MYAQAREGIIKGLSGVDEDFEVPKDANLTVDLTEHSIPQVVHSALHSTSCIDLSFIGAVGIVLLLETSGLL